MPHETVNQRAARSALPQPRAAAPASAGQVAPDQTAAIAVSGLRKSFGEKLVLDGIDLSVAAGTVFALLGPNGAGKTTAVHILSTLIPGDGGHARVAGHDVAAEPDAVRAVIGVTGQFSAVDSLLTGRENLILMADLHRLGKVEGRRRADALLGRFDLAEAGGQRVMTYSGGMKRRLDLAMTLIGEPRVIFLDEPTTGLDPQARHVVWDRLYRLKQQGTTLILTTHYMDEAEQLCDRLVVMDKGRIAAEGSPRELIEHYATREVLELRFQLGEQEQAAEKLAGIGERLEPLPDRVLVYADDGEAALTEAYRRGLEPLTALVRRSTLEDVFLHLTGRTLVD